ncbi:MAG: amidohydrolase family protein [Candidatus Brocadiia bacterium]
MADETRPLRFDIHVHYLDEPSADNGVVVGPKQRLHPFTLFMRGIRFLTCAKPFPEILARELDSPMLDRAVILAMDGCYRNGKLDRKNTAYYVPNALVADFCGRHPKALLGASINPMRCDAMDELERVAVMGTVLIKWLPYSQGFDPSEAAIKPFYRRLAQLRIPLLIHTGPEYSLISNPPRLSDTSVLIPALDEGVTVIAAHSSLPDSVFSRSKAEFKRFRVLLDRFPNLYGDTAALFGASRVRQMDLLLKDDMVRSRVLNGSDYPIPQLWRLAGGKINREVRRTVSAQKNYFSREYLLKKELGLEESFVRPATVLRLPSDSPKGDIERGLNA